MPADHPKPSYEHPRDHLHDHLHDHRHDQQHDQQHEDGVDGTVLSGLDLTVRALESLLVAKGYIDPAAIDEIIETYERDVGPHLGAQVVAKAWTDFEFKAWLLRDATAAIASLGISGRQGEHMVVVESTPELHHMVVCTLCSCYPWPLLGLPPRWYKSAPYRSRVVIDPHGVLADFGVTLADSTKVRVWDSTAEIRYLVLPLRPAGTEGWDDARLASLVTRDAMIGTGVVRLPGTSEGDL